MRVYPKRIGKGAGEPDYSSSRVDAGVRRVAPPRSDLAGRTQYELRVRTEISAAEPSRLRAKPMQPLESTALHPCRSARFRAGDEVERRPNADQCGRCDLAHMPRHPELLTRSSEGAPHDVRTSGANVLDDLRLGGVDVASRRRVGADDSRTRIGVFEIPLESREHIGCRAEEEVAHTGRNPRRDDERHQIRPPDSLRSVVAESPLQPGDGRTVRKDDPRLVECSSQLRVVLRSYQDVRVPETRVAASPRPRSLDHRLCRRAQVADEAVDAEHAAASRTRAMYESDAQYAARSRTIAGNVRSTRLRSLTSDQPAT